MGRVVPAPHVTERQDSRSSRAPRRMSGARHRSNWVDAHDDANVRVRAELDPDLPLADKLLEQSTLPPRHAHVRPTLRRLDGPYVVSLSAKLEPTPQLVHGHVRARLYEPSKLCRSTSVRRGAGFRRTARVRLRIERHGLRGRRRRGVVGIGRPLSPRRSVVDFAHRLMSDAGRGGSESGRWRPGAPPDDSSGLAPSQSRGVLASSLCLQRIALDWDAPRGSLASTPGSGSDEARTPAAGSCTGRPGPPVRVRHHGPRAARG